ncbi:hypothetical protein [Saccharopolyspora spinosa]|uniref:Uncharacterized protein n=1 Tax=Saccharopolyspora spinosa TaxID=60894 RepID=A0A2N3Y4E4_SACSN|nr:hypothetical protein [Saccharopolyspora spinosa]PKW17802.1 hypothetical protein A8926_5819 [Saccharopolyspora spinosa]
MTIRRVNDGLPTPALRLDGAAYASARDTERGRQHRWWRALRN